MGIDDNSDSEKSLINPEVASQMAKAIAKRQVAMIELLRNYPPHNKPDDHTFIEKDEFKLRIATHNESVLPLTGTKFITFVHGFKKYPGDFPELVGTDTLNRLDIGVHTDEQTQEQIEGLQERDPKAFNILQSIYFFDENGNYGKIVSLPRYFRDDRPDVGHPGVIQKYIIGEMKPGDFELVDIALSILENKLQPSQPQT